MFQTDDSWERKYPFRLKGDTFIQTGLREYPCIRLPLNIFIFHVDAKFHGPYPDDLPRGRFLFHSINQVLSFISQDTVIYASVHLQSKFSEGDEYEISSVVAVISGKDRNGDETYLYRCKNGKTYCDSFFGKSEQELTETRKIWER